MTAIFRSRRLALFAGLALCLLAAPPVMAQYAGDSYGYGSQDRDDGNVYARAGAVTTRRVPPSPPGATPRADLEFEVGDRVTHDKFGLGTVVGLEGSGRNAVAKVDFGEPEGVKRLVLRFHAIQKL